MYWKSMHIYSLMYIYIVSSHTLAISGWVINLRELYRVHWLGGWLIKVVYFPLCETRVTWLHIYIYISTRSAGKLWGISINGLGYQWRGREKKNCLDCGLLEGDLMRCDCLLLCVFCLSPLYDRDVCVCVCKGDYSLFSCNKCMRCVNVWLVGSNCEWISGIWRRW